MKRGDIWLTDLDPTRGSEIQKVRPAVIVQNNIGNAYSQTTIVAPITSQRTLKLYPFEVSLPLRKKSKVLLHQIRTVDKQRCIRKLGKVHAATMGKIDTALRISLGL